MKIFAIICALCAVFSLYSQTTSTIFGGIRTVHENEYYFFKTPEATFFTEQIYANSLWLDGIHSQITGEFMEISSIGEASLSNSLVFQYQLRHFLNARNGLFTRMGFMSGTHKQNFDLLYFNFQTESLQQQKGVFKSKRNSFDFHLGYSFRPFQNPDFIIDAGPLLQWISYRQVEAHIESFNFVWEGEIDYWLPGAAVQASYNFIPDTNFTLGLAGELRMVVIDKNITPFAGISVQLSYYHSKTKPLPEKRVSVVQGFTLPGHIKKFLPVYLTSYQRLVDPEVISQDKISISYTSAFLDENKLQSLEPFDGIVYLHSEEVLINNIQNEIYELSYQKPDSAPVSFETSDYNVYPQFIAIESLPATENSFLIHLESDTERRTVIVYREINPEVLSHYPDLERKIENGRSKVSSARERKERLRRERDSILALYDSLEQKYNQLVYIDKILERYPPVFKKRVNNILDSLKNYGEKTGSIKDRIKQINADKENCEKKKNEISGLLAEKEKDCKKLRTDVENAISKLESAYLFKMGITATITLDGNGGISVAFKGVMLNEYDKTTRKARDEIRKMRKQLEELAKKLKDCEEVQSHLQGQLDTLNDHCESLKEEGEASAAMLDDASSSYNAHEQELKDQCEIIKSAVVNILKKWCDENPDICNFKGELEDFLKEDCPKTKEEWDAFWDKFDDLLGKKIALENAIQEEIKQAEDDYDTNTTESDKADREISDGLKEVFDAENEAAARRKDEERAAKIAAEEKRKRDEERRKRKEKEKKIKDLVEKIKNGEAGDDALKDLLILTGLGLLDEVTGNLKIGTIIGGLLVIKDQPDCVCPLLNTLKNAIAAANRGDKFETGIHANEFIRLWKDCGNLIHISSIMEGSNFLTDAIMEMSKEQKQRALEALESAINVNCK